MLQKWVSPAIFIGTTACYNGLCLCHTENERPWTPDHSYYPVRLIHVICHEFTSIEYSEKSNKNVVHMHQSKLPSDLAREIFLQVLSRK